MALNFNQFAKEANTFMELYAKELNLGDDTEKAGRILSSILHGLREVISLEESLQLMAQLPMFLKAVYANGWTSRKDRKIKTMDDFIELIKKLNGKTASIDFSTDEIAENYINSTFIVLRRYLSLGELEDIRTHLPKELKSMVYQRLMF